jgi:peroxisomal trans-2-enoyl-CoA reductase
MSQNEGTPVESAPEQPSIFRDGLFEDKVAVITGGGSGIGFSIAAELRLLGAHVLIGSRNPDKLARGKELLETVDGPGKVWTHTLNIREHDSIGEFLDAAVEEFGKIDYLVNNAGGQFPSPAATISERGWNAVIETNLTGTFTMSQQTALKSMIPNGQGVIVNIIAQMWNGFPMMAHTGAARAGVDNLAKSLSVEWAQAGIRVNSVAPGIIESAGIGSYSKENQKIFYGAIPYIPAGRLGTPREIAAATVFLLSPAAAFITGTTLRVDGGEPLFGSSAAGMNREILQGKPPEAYE